MARRQQSSCPNGKERMSSQVINHLLSRLSAQDGDLLTKHLEPVDLPLRFSVEIANKPISHVYFPHDGIVSIVATGAHDQSIEVGIIGRDGMTGHPVVMGTDRSANAAYMQVAGHGLRIETDHMRGALHKSETLRFALQAFLQAFSTQAAHTALANGCGTIEQRLARWLLMANDRLTGDQLPLTHEFLALMLGVQRPGVTLALQALESMGLISNQRSVVVIKHRSGLKKIAHGIYGVPEAEQERLTEWRPLPERNRRGARK